MTLPSQSAGHTEGPWVAKQDERDWCVVTDRFKERPEFWIAKCYSHADTDTTGEANARLIARAPDLLAENSKLKGQLAEAVWALEPFAREEFCVELGGNVEGDMSPVFARNHAMLRIGDFRAARDLLSKLKEAGS